MTAVLVGSTAMVITRPEVTAGPMERAFRPEKGSAGGESSPSSDPPGRAALFGVDWVRTGAAAVANNSRMAAAIRYIRGILVVLGTDAERSRTDAVRSGADAVRSGS